MTLTLYETVQRIVRQEMARLRVAEIGIVEATHPHAGDSDKDNYACSVRLRDSGLVLKRAPVATPRLGVASIPSVGDMVLVQFIGGDVNAPVIVGSLYNDQERPPVNADGQAVLHLPLGGGDSDSVHIEISSGQTRQLVIKIGDALAITAKDDDPVLEVSVDGGKATVKLERDGAVTVESSGNVQIKGNEVKIEAQGQLTLKGATVNIN